MSRQNSLRFATADALHSGAIHLLRLVRVQDTHAGIGPAQLSVLSVLVFHGQRTVSELAALEQVRPPTMSRVIEGLVQKQLAQRSSAHGDRRSVCINATPAGTKLLLAVKNRRVRALAKRLESLTRAELETLHAAAGLISRL